ncbi:GNAT family N-acetyltransferase [Bacillus luteolus]|uniref:GNAT family N-acetyltransferase n=1 Tax=Litchfieldia luteola TaxID=682179 RepID=A0ABR9QKE6_9BACI|nr:GNAT family N-acetyltransferase [Cytobacillus luteolus]MBE4908881.1 GNAT family N-acetyltransferase [Cytobacillus luteolus]MBP1941739.1 GNAT superfamily N-acetyltransferase [Cytobacillus luteolus]
MKPIEMAPHHLDFFTILIEDSPLWKENELKDLSLDAYMHGYTSLQGDWQVWLDKGILIGITFTVNKAPSNNKMWLGTILIAKEHRNKGFARRIIKELAIKALSKGDEAIFCGIPIEINEWSMFLGNCGFEQFKIEKDKTGQNYLVFVYPL